MSYTLVIHTLAAAEMREAIATAYTFGDDVGQRFRSALSDALVLAERMPYALGVLSYNDRFRRAGIRYSPLQLIVEVQGDLVRVLACAHEKRRPDYWAER